MDEGRSPRLVVHFAENNAVEAPLHRLCCFVSGRGRHELDLKPTPCKTDLDRGRPLAGLAQEPDAVSTDLEDTKVFVAAPNEEQGDHGRPRLARVRGAKGPGTSPPALRGLVQAHAHQLGGPMKTGWRGRGRLGQGSLWIGGLRFRFRVGGLERTDAPRDDAVGAGVGGGDRRPRNGPFGVAVVPAPGHRKQLQYKSTHWRLASVHVCEVRQGSRQSELPAKLTHWLPAGQSESDMQGPQIALFGYSH